jgi:predicted RNA binding protein YcfA (HicA-like mRNA interferase family)
VSVLADVTGPEAVKAFRKAGWSVQRQAGSHGALAKEGVRELIVVPVHVGRALKRGLLLGAIRTAGRTIEEFRGLL